MATIFGFVFGGIAGAVAGIFGRGDLGALFGGIAGFIVSIPVSIWAIRECIVKHGLVKSESD